ncbi:MAG: SPOR domain-containing protein [Gammaproteobacteria bacterium]|nr:SPOR domain-containing protein [Gammaproteobacteria bacterium]MBT8134003.1 SPOR domain-containing protein [Gammaproteobacteria bacterium]NNJ50526.1 SPOR domain-containing protein [Gammaproteobacteria bacterium]
MAPLLIDGRDLLKFVLVSVVAVTTVFVSGVFLGHQQAATFYQAGSDVQPLPLPERVEVAENTFESQQPAEIAVGEFIDVDHPASAATPAMKNPDISTMVSESKRESVLGKDIKTRADKKRTNHRDIAVSEIESLPIKNKIKGSEQNDAEQLVTTSPSAMDDPLVVASPGTNNLNMVKYSIQVGMYGSLTNAENMMKTLRVEEYEAYITDYTNKKNETRYNVRFGYFIDKKSARASLEKFKNDKNGDGYLVKFSADNILNLADAGKTGMPAVQIEDHGKTPGPTVTPSASTIDKISQADVLTDTHIKAN